MNNIQSITSLFNRVNAASRETGNLAGFSHITRSRGRELNSSQSLQSSAKTLNSGADYMNAMRAMKEARGIVPSCCG